MATPIILVDGVAPPPLGIKNNGLKTDAQVCALALQSMVGIQSLEWRVDAIPGSSAVVDNPTPTFPFATTVQLNGVGTYRVTAIANSNQAGNEIAVATLVVPTPNLGLRIPIPGEQNEYDDENWYHDTIAEAILAIDDLGGGGGGSTPFYAASNSANTLDNTSPIQILLWTPPAGDGAWNVHVDLIGFGTSGASTGQSDGAEYFVHLKRVGGVLTVNGYAARMAVQTNDFGTTTEQAFVSSENFIASCTVAFDIQSDKLRVRVTGFNSDTFAWTATAWTMKVLS